MKYSKNFVIVQAGISNAAVLVLLAGALTACNQGPSEKPVVVVTPSTQASATTPASPSPQVSPTSPTAANSTPQSSTTTTTTAVSPNPQTSTSTTTTAVSPSPQASTSTTTTTTKTVVIKEPITEVVTVTSAPNPTSLVNKRVQFTSTKVLSVIGDRPFWVGRSNNEKLAVVLDPALDKGSAENKIVIKPGQTLDIAGVLKPMPSPETAQKQWGLSASEAQGFQAKTVYLQADKINFKSK
jgi:hypothetical protein